MKKNIKNIVDYYVKKCGSRNPFGIADYLNVQIQIGQLGALVGVICSSKTTGAYFLMKTWRKMKWNW